MPLSTREVALAWLSAFHRHDAAAAAALYHENAINTQFAVDPPGGGTIGRAALLAGFTDFFNAFPDSTTQLDNLLVDHDRAAFEWTGTGTWKGPFAGKPPSGRFYTLQGCGFIRVVDGLIIEQHGYWDRHTWFGQIGLE